MRANCNGNRKLTASQSPVRQRCRSRRPLSSRSNDNFLAAIITRHFVLFRNLLMTTHYLFSSMLGLAFLGLATGITFAADVSTNTPVAQDVWISSLDVTRIEQGYGEGRADRSVDNRRLTVAGQAYPNGVGMHANSIISLEVDGNALVLSGNAGVDDESGRGTVVFKVQADGKEIWNSGLMKPKDAAKEFSLDVKGVKSLVLLVADGGDGIDGDHADWGNLKVTMTSGKPRLIVPPIEEAVVLTPKPAPTPRITGARLFGVRHGSPFFFTVTSTGDRPMTFSADGLPSGLQLDAQSGRITGKLDKEGEYVVTLQAKNELGHAERKLKIVCGSQIGLTPAMGWNSWNCFANAVTEERVKSAADAMVNSGLINHGWIYINIDDYWQVHRNSRDATLQGPARAADGRILPNPRFPDMKALTESDQAQVALQDYAGGTAATTARYYLQPLPIRRGQRLGMGDRGQWQFLAHHGRHQRQ